VVRHGVQDRGVVHYGGLRSCQEAVEWYSLEITTGDVDDGVRVLIVPVASTKVALIQVIDNLCITRAASTPLAPTGLNNRRTTNAQFWHLCAQRLRLSSRCVF
jgi:hypothetical protein